MGLYPIGPVTKSTPNFSSYSSLIRFLGDGPNGLLGYTYNLASERDILRLENHLLRQEKDTALQILHQTNEKISTLEKTIQDLRRKQTSLGPRLRSRKPRNIETLKHWSGGCNKRIKVVR